MTLKTKVCNCGELTETLRVTLKELHQIVGVLVSESGNVKLLDRCAKAAHWFDLEMLEAKPDLVVKVEDDEDDDDTEIFYDF